MKPLYSFQVGPTGQGHGHAEHKGEAEQRKREEQAAQRTREEKAAFHEKLRKENIAEWVWIGLMNGGLFGFVVGFFRSCSTQQLSVDAGTWFVTLLVCAGIGAAIGLAVGNALES